MLESKLSSTEHPNRPLQHHHRNASSMHRQFRKSTNYVICGSKVTRVTPFFCTPTMARRAAQAGPSTAYISPAHISGRHESVDPNETTISRFIREEIVAPQHLPGNVNIVAALCLFVGGIVAVRQFGDILVFP
ncbi:hypothetical protein BD410DRAFT_262122 [Rickenella mellea]|uniref:Uncharacterized protein n=1 Tax=Rickenella mellea TaxID=50990 RepID=A0A4Y7Q466_9AGAM|nr:hypothetical protein BD410DRAFT_262122 [Rickenella mellea]